jgi:hypothetical protein
VQLVGGVDRVLHLGARVGENVRVRIGRRARHVARVAEEIRRPPQELDAGREHLLGEAVGHLREIAAEFGEARAFRDHVLVVEGEEREAEGREHLEGDVGLEPRALHVLVVPGAREGRGAEHVRTHPAEIVPVADGRAEVLGHRLAHDDPARVVMPEGQGIVALRTLVSDRSDIAKEPLGHALPPLEPARSAYFARMRLSGKEEETAKLSSLLRGQRAGRLPFATEPIPGPPESSEREA